MVKLTRVQSTLLMAALIITSLEALPIQAAIRQQPQQLPTAIQGTYLATSVGEIVDSLGRKKGPGGGRPGNRRGLICALAPMKLVDQDTKPQENQGIQEVWSDHPLFLWTIPEGGVEKIELFQEGNDTALWSRPIPQGKTSIIYDGEALKPGQSYEWRLTPVGSFAQRQLPFQVMAGEERDRITAELRQLEARLKNASAETRALEKADYFAKKELWSDALRELYSVSKPSAELTKAIKQIQDYDFCTQKPKNSAS